MTARSASLCAGKGNQPRKDVTTASPVSALRFLFVRGGKRLHITGFEHLIAIQAPEVIDAIAPGN